jgi:hypothetical protein
VRKESGRGLRGNRRGVLCLRQGPDAEVYRREREERAKRTLFQGLKFFLSREVPLSWVHFVISSFGGQVGWDGHGSPFAESDPSITHHVIDRPQPVRRRGVGVGPWLGCWC